MESDVFVRSCLCCCGMSVTFHTRFGCTGPEPEVSKTAALCLTLGRGSVSTGTASTTNNGCSG
eukprot:2801897-Karenia_brevis.AAC.1